MEPTPQAMLVGDDDDIFGADPDDAEGEDIDMTAFAMQLNEEMDEDSEDEDFLAAAVADTQEPHRLSGQPMSLNQLAGGGEASQDEDDFSSSDDSDDD